MTRVRLIKKLASVFNGIDLSKVEVGEIIYLPNAAAEILVREGWAEQIVDDPNRK
ncbi:MAG TPA: hypothetical protein VM115_11835 [Vicinamibacterales bacterium]|nr:hypothetical protein [Vicinamibacterales bacterium]